MKRKFHELNLYSYIFYRHLENTIILTWKILILASFLMILDSDLGFQNRFSGKCTRFFWVANPSVCTRLSSRIPRVVSSLIRFVTASQTKFTRQIQIRDTQIKPTANQPFCTDPMCN
jgi:hypothetical protein